MPETTFTCRHCGEILTGEAAFDPEYQGPKTSYLHPQCAQAVRQELDLKRQRIEKAAPDLLAACEAALEAIPEDWYSDPGPDGTGGAPLIARQLRAAIAKAKGETP